MGVLFELHVRKVKKIIHGLPGRTRRGSGARGYLEATSTWSWPLLEVKARRIPRHARDCFHGEMPYGTGAVGLLLRVGRELRASSWRRLLRAPGRTSRGPLFRRARPGRAGRPGWFHIAAEKTVPFDIAPCPAQQRGFAPTRSHGVDRFRPRRLVLACTTTPSPPAANFLGLREPPRALARVACRFSAGTFLEARRSSSGRHGRVSPRKPVHGGLVTSTSFEFAGPTKRFGPSSHASESGVTRHAEMGAGGATVPPVGPGRQLGACFVSVGGTAVRI